MGGQVPALGRLGVPDRLDREPALRKPAGRPLVQPGNGIRLGPAQLQLQQVDEQVVIAELRAGRIQ